MKDFYLAQLEREAPLTRRALERVPEGQADWKPHDKSMALGNLSSLVSTMPGWIAMMINQDELDLNPPGGSSYRPALPRDNRELLQALDDSVAKGSEALRKTTDEHLLTPWRLLVAQKVVVQNPRHVFLSDTFTHLAHHRGQLTVYLRLRGVAVPSIYGPTADDARF